MTSATSTRPVQHVRLGDIEVTYRVAGEAKGRPVVLVHGLAQDHRSWSGLQDTLADRASYAYDLRGHGSTTIGDADGSAEQLRDDLVAFLEDVTGPAVCVGFSLGGTVVLAAAAARPDLVRQAVVMGTSSVVGRPAAAFYAQRIELFRGTDQDAKTEALRSDTAAALHVPGADLDAETHVRVEALGDGSGYVNAAAAMASLVEAPLTPVLATIGAQVPVTVIGADHDTFCPRKAADIILEAVPHADYLEVTDAGHLMLIDQPERAAAVLAGCLLR